MSSPRKIKLMTSDHEVFEVEEAVALESQTLRHMIEDDCADDAIPLPNVTGNTLVKVIEYCREHCKPSDPEVHADEKDLKSWDAAFSKAINNNWNSLIELILAANYLDIKGLLDLTCQAAADQIAGLGPEEIRKTFNIKNDFTPEEEEEIRRQNQWAFD